MAGCAVAVSVVVHVTNCAPWVFFSARAHLLGLWVKASHTCWWSKFGSGPTWWCLIIVLVFYGPQHCHYDPAVLCSSHTVLCQMDHMACGPLAPPLPPSPHGQYPGLHARGDRHLPTMAPQAPKTIFPLVTWACTGKVRFGSLHVVSCPGEGSFGARSPRDKGERRVLWGDCPWGHGGLLFQWLQVWMQSHIAYHTCT